MVQVWGERTIQTGKVAGKDTIDFLLFQLRGIWLVLQEVWRLLGSWCFCCCLGSEGQPQKVPSRGALLEGPLLGCCLELWEHLSDTLALGEKSTPKVRGKLLTAVHVSERLLLQWLQRKCGMWMQQNSVLQPKSEWHMPFSFWARSVRQLPTEMLGTTKNVGQA